MRIVHLSDFHITNDGLKDTVSFIVKALIEDLNKFHNSNPIDFIFFTGDLIDKGGLTFKSIDEGFEKFDEFVITPIINSLKIDRNRFIFVPGNHDIARNVEAEYIQIGLASTLNSIEKVSSFIDRNETEGIKRIIPFKNFERKFHNKSQGITNYQSSFILQINNKKVGITAFNTAWRCYDSDHDFQNIILGLRQVTDASKLLEDCDVKIALMHHQLDYLVSFDLEVVEPAIKREYDMLLCGHVHKGSNYSESSIYGDIFVSVAPSNTTGNIWNNDQRLLNGYSIIDYEVEEKEKIFTVYNQRYSQKHDRYIANIESNPDNNGIITYFNKSRKDRTGFKKKTPVNLSEIESINTHINQSGKAENLSTQKFSPDYSVSNITIKNNQTEYKFSKSDNLKKYAQQIFSQSIKYDYLKEDIETSIFVMDRLLKEVERKDDFIEYIEKLDDLINQIESNNHEKRQSLISLFGLVEWWLLSISKLYNIGNNIVSGLTISEIFDKIIFINEDGSEDDFLNILLISAKDTIFYIKQGNLQRLSLKSDFSLISEVVAALLFPVCINMNMYQRISAGKEISLMESEETKDLINSIKSEYNLHLLWNKGRETEIEYILTNINLNNITIIRGEKSVGKSNVIASVINQINSVTYDYLNPVILVFSFKYSNNIAEFVKTIVEQCNTNLINKIDLTPLDKISQENIKSNTEEVIIVSKYEILKPYLFEALKRTVKECGSVYLVIDSLELIEKEEDKLIFLLQEIPEGVHLLLSTGIKGECTNWLLKNEKTSKNILELTSLTRNKIPFITELNDEILEDKRKNDEVFAKTNGQVAHIRKILTKFNFSIENMQIDEIEASLEEVYPSFEIAAEICINNEILEESLLLLSILEDMQPITLEYLQFFLNHRNMHYRMPRIRNELKKMEYHLSDIRFNRIKLINHDFAKFIISKHFSPKDVEEFIEIIFTWLSADTKISVKFLCEFIKALQKNQLIVKQKFDVNINLFIENLVKSNSSRTLFTIGFYLYMEFEDESELALKFLEKAAENRITKAITFLGIIYLGDEKVSQDINKAELYLKEASLLGDASAKGILSSLLLDGTKLQRDIVEGKELLEEAVALGNITAKIDLAVRLIIGKDMGADLKRGNQLLFELLESENIEAMRIVGAKYLYGEGLERDIEKGKELLVRAMENGNDIAKFILSKYLISYSNSNDDITDGMKYLNELIHLKNMDAKRYLSEVLLKENSLNRDIDKGISILLELVEEGDEESSLDYAILLFEGILINQNIVKAKQLLDKLVDKNYIDGVSFLGFLLIDGEYYNKDVDRGLELLIIACNAGDVQSRRKLGWRYMNGYGIRKDISEGRRLFNEAINRGDVFAKYLLAKSIINQPTDEKNENNILEAIKLLREAEQAGIRQAKSLLGNLLLDGEMIDRDIDKGLVYLNSAIDLGESEAMRELGFRYLWGIVLPKNHLIGEELLRKSIYFGDILAKTILGHAIVLGEATTKDVYFGINLLEQASKTEVNAMRILGIMLLRGERINKNKERGETLLRQAYDKEDNNASLRLATMLIEGRYLTKKIEEGKEILIRLVEKKYDDAIIEVANRLIEGKGFIKDTIKGLMMLESLEKNNLDAKYYYALKLISGEDGVVKDKRKGERLLREGEEQGHDNSRRLLAKFIIDGYILEKEKGEAIKLLEKCVDENDFKAMSFLATLYLEGEKVERNIEKAIELFNLSITGIDNDCKVSYASRLVKGDILNKDINKGIDLLTEAADAGNSKAKYQLAKIFIIGNLINDNYDKGIKLIDELIEDGYDEAKIFLARSLIFGNRMNKNISRGVELFEELVISDNATGIVIYAEILIDGTYVQKDLLRGEKLLKNLSQKGDLDASYLLAKRYLKGDGLKKHISSGTNKLLKAASHYLEEAMLEYGIRLKRGNKIPKDEQKGKEYIEKAIKSASVGELQNLGIIAYNLDDFDVASELFIKLMDMKYYGSGTSLAYMYRRNELKHQGRSFDIFKLLEYGLSNNDDTAIINLALALLVNDDSEYAWIKADLIFEGLSNCAIAADWWYEVAKQNNDAEGHLVLGWLSKYKKIEDPDNMTFTERLDLASKEWAIPEWMYIVNTAD